MRIDWLCCVYFLVWTWNQRLQTVQLLDSVCFLLSLSLVARVLCVVSCIQSRFVVSLFACSLSSKRLCCYSVHLVVHVHFASIVLYLENNYFANCGRWVREYVYWGLRIIHNYPMRCMFFLISSICAFYLHSHELFRMR